MNYSKHQNLNNSLMGFNEIDYGDITDEDMHHVGKEIARYLNLFLNVMVVPKELRSNEKELKENIKIVKELIKKLKKGDKSIFKEDI